MFGPSPLIGIGGAPTPAAPIGRGAPAVMPGTLVGIPTGGALASVGTSADPHRNAWTQEQPVPHRSFPGRDMDRIPTG